MLTNTLTQIPNLPAILVLAAGSCRFSIRTVAPMQVRRVKMALLIQRICAENIKCECTENNSICTNVSKQWVAGDSRTPATDPFRDLNVILSGQCYGFGSFAGCRSSYGGRENGLRGGVQATGSKAGSVDAQVTSCPRQAAVEGVDSCLRGLESLLSNQ